MAAGGAVRTAIINNNDDEERSSYTNRTRAFNKYRTSGPPNSICIALAL